MATWNVGAFDNDAADEWRDQFEATAPGRRTETVRRALRQAVSRSAVLTDTAAAEVVAAAAVVLQARTGLPDATTPHATRFVVGATDIEATPELLRLARAALKAIMREESPWRLRWADHIEGDLALEVLERLHAALGGTYD
jgi:hypothetical protein